jgi:hypothetical protein
MSIRSKLAARDAEIAILKTQLRLESMVRDDARKQLNELNDLIKKHEAKLAELRDAQNPCKTQ